MAENYYQHDGEYPFIDELPEKIENLSIPLPSGFFLQKDTINEGYPYLDVPDSITELTKPLPYIMYKPNKAKKIEYKIVIQNSDNKIVISKYDMVLKSDIMR